MRESETNSNKAISYLYEWFSDFGASWVKPIVRWFTHVIISASILCCCDGAVLNYPEESYKGWQTYLIDTKEFSRLARALYLSFQSMVNPLGIFNHRAALVPSHPLLAVMLWLQSIFSVALITLIVGSIHKRFRIQH